MDSTSNTLVLTEKERAQWMLHRLLPGLGICNIGSVIRVGTFLSTDLLQAAVDHVMDRHPGLKTVVETSAAGPRRRQLPDVRVPVEVIPVASAATPEVDELVRAVFTAPLDAERGPLLRVRLIAAPTASVICFVFHHLVADGVSVQVVLREVAVVYDALRAGVGIPADLCAVVPVRAEPPIDTATIRHWVAHLAGVDPRRQALPAAKPIAESPTFAGARVDYSLDPATVDAVRGLRLSTRSTDNIVLLAAYYLLLAMHGAGPDLVVGVPTAGRPQDEEIPSVGYYADTLPLRVPVDMPHSFRHLVSRVRGAFLAALAHGKFSFEAVQAELALHTTDWRTPLFRHSFNYSRVELGTGSMAGEPVEITDGHHGLSRLDLELSVYDEDGPCRLTAEYSAEAFDRGIVADLLERYERILVAVAAQPDAPLQDVDFTTAKDRRILARSAGPITHPPTRTVLDRVMDRALRGPERRAFGDRTYGQVAAVAHAVRDELVRRGVEQGEIIGLHAARGPALAASLLGVWLARCAYVPLEPGQPDERLVHVVGDTAARIVLTDRPTVWLPAGVTPVRIDTLPPATGSRGHGPPDGDDLAFVIYTSGSTGRPKGVEVRHSSLANLVEHFVTEMAISERDAVLWLNSFSFDMSSLELLAALSAGARLVPVPNRVRLRPRELARSLVAENTTIVMATPTMYRILEPDLPQSLPGARLLSGGEPLDAALATRLLARGCRLFNGYGPVEATACASMVELQSPVTDPVPVGRPITNTAVHVLGPAGLPVPPGVPGELCIAGDGVAVGYRNDPALTASRFVDDPRLGRYYRTGDRGRYGPDGLLLFIGRVDRQVKVRGQRIELGEVETVLARHPGVAAAAAWTQPHSTGGDELVAVVTPVRREEADRNLVADVHAFAAATLPSAGVPSRIAVVRTLPRTVNGKVDYWGLADTFGSPVESDASALPADNTTRVLVRLWREILGDRSLTESSNFFLSGGHSILAVELARRVSAETGREIGFEVVFRAQTPATMAAALGASDRR